jgi:hypothetical protein
MNETVALESTWAWLIINLRRSGPEGTGPSAAAIGGKWYALESAVMSFKKSRVRDKRRH